MFTLNNFYKSKEWITLVSRLKLERVEGDGYIHCAKCGNPIVRPYDCIGHHIIPLTETNVNDYNISLNPNNIELLHFKCHNIEHHRFCSYTQNVYIVYGPPLSGKTSYVEEIATSEDIIVDIDKIWQMISINDRYIKPNRLKINVFAIRDELIDMIATRRGNWLDAYVIGGYPYKGERERLCTRLGASEIFIDVSKEECIKRLYKSNDRDINSWSKYIEDWFMKSNIGA